MHSIGPEQWHILSLGKLLSILKHILYAGAFALTIYMGDQFVDNTTPMDKGSAAMPVQFPDL